MLYNVLVGFVFAQLHYTTKRLLPFFFWMQPFLLFFYSAIFLFTAVMTFFRQACVRFAELFQKVRRIIQIFVEMHKLNRDNAQIPSLNIINPCKTHLKHGIMISYRRTCPLPGAAAKLFRRTQENVQDSYQENPQPHSYSYGS